MYGTPPAPARPRWAGHARMRARFRALPGGRLIWRIGVTVLGVAVLAVGVLLLALPGPGWLIIFAGLGLLGSEYAWARRLLIRVRGQLRRGTLWVAGRALWLRLLAGLVSLVVLAAIVAAAWLVTFGL